MKLINYIGETKMKDKKIGENHNKIDNSEKINGNYIKRTPYNVLNILEENINFILKKRRIQ